MTAPLPPLPADIEAWFGPPGCYVPGSDQDHSCCISVAEMQDYAKLAVREALERVVIILDESEGDIGLLHFKLKRMIAAAPAQQEPQCDPTATQCPKHKNPHGGVCDFAQQEPYKSPSWVTTEGEHPDLTPLAQPPQQSAEPVAFPKLEIQRLREEAEQAEPVAWRDLAYANLGAVRDQMQPWHVTAVQDWLQGIYPDAAPPADEAVTLLSEWLDRVDDDDPTLTLEWVEGFEKRVRDFLAKVKPCQS